MDQVKTSVAMRRHHPAMLWVIIDAAWQLRGWLADSPADRPADLIRRSA